MLRWRFDLRPFCSAGVRSVWSALSVTSVGLIGTAGYMAGTFTGVIGVPSYAGLGVGALQLAKVETD